MYGETRRYRYLIGFGLVAALLIVVIILIMTSGHGKPPVTKQALASYAGDSSVSVTETIVGPVSAAQDHARANITVTNQAATVTKYQGYDGTVVANASYPMTQASFTEFLAALDKAGFTKGNTDPDLSDDKGYCPLGERYIFTLTQGASTLERFWATNCGGTKTYRGNLNLTITLFADQITDYNTIVGGPQNNNGSLAL